MNGALALQYVTCICSNLLHSYLYEVESNYCGREQKVDLEIRDVAPVYTLSR